VGLGLSRWLGAGSLGAGQGAEGVPQRGESNPLSRHRWRQTLSGARALCRHGYRQRVCLDRHGGLPKLSILAPGARPGSCVLLPFPSELAVLPWPVCATGFACTAAAVSALPGPPGICAGGLVLAHRRGMAVRARYRAQRGHRLRRFDRNCHGPTVSMTLSVPTSRAFAWRVRVFLGEQISHSVDMR